MLMAVLCLVDIIKDNETLTESRTEDKCKQKSVQHGCQLHLLDTCFLSARCCLMFPRMDDVCHAHCLLT